MKKLLLLALLALSACHRGGGSGDVNFSEVSGPVLTKFRDEDRTFSLDLKASIGTKHGEVPDWYKICGATTDNDREMKDALLSISFEFKKGLNDVDVTASCKNPEGGKNLSKLYNFKYRGKAVDEDNLLIGMDLNGKVAEGRWDKDRDRERRGNLLEFFSQASWIYLGSKNEILGISQLARNGYRAGDKVKDLPLANQSDFEEAKGFISEDKGKENRDDGYDIAKDVPGILLVLKEQE